MTPPKAIIVFGIELGENVTMTLASAGLLMLGTMSSLKHNFLFYFYTMATPCVHTRARLPCTVMY